MSNEQQADFDSSFEQLRQDASERIGDLVGELVNTLPFTSEVVIKMLHSTLDGFHAYMMSCPAICTECGAQLGDGCEDDDDDDDDSEVVPVGFDE